MTGNRTIHPTLAVRASALLVAAALCGCTPSPATPTDPRPDVVLVTIDTLRADHCSVAGYSKPTTPNLERLARGGTYLEAASAPMPTTGPAHVSLFTGVYPRSHGLVRNGIQVPASLTTLAEVLDGQGWQTAGFVSSFVLSSRFGFAKGFKTYGGEVARVRGPHSDDRGEDSALAEGLGRRADETTRSAAAWLDKRDAAAQEPGSKNAPFFLWVHYFDPHDPYDPPEPFRHDFATTNADATDLDRLKSAYDGEIAFADSQLGVLLDAIARRSDHRGVLVMVVGDHGEGLMDHGFAHHGLQIYEESVHVPWIVWWPGHVPAGRRVTAPVTTVDLMPTMLGLLGETLPPAVQGRALTGLIASDSAAADASPVVLQRRFFQSQQVEGNMVSGDKYGIRVGRWKYLEAPGEGTHELFDLETDPRETRNLADTNAEAAADMVRRLRAWLDATPSARVDSQSLAPNTAERLRSLGYVP